MDKYSLSHTTWCCKYHIVFTPKYRRNTFYGIPPQIVWGSEKLIQQDVNAEPAVRLYGAFMYKYSPYRSKLVEG